MPKKCCPTCGHELAERAPVYRLRTTEEIVNSLRVEFKKYRPTKKDLKKYGIVK